MRHRHLSVKQRNLVSVKFPLKIQERTETKKIDTTEIVSTKSVCADIDLQGSTEPNGSDEKMRNLG